MNVRTDSRPFRPAPLLAGLLALAVSAGTAAAQAEGRSSLEPTDDGVYVSIRYFAPPRPGREVPVVLLCHDRDGSQRDWFGFAQELQAQNMAVYTFDWRGHGESREVDPTVYMPPKIALVEEEKQRRRRRIPVVKPRVLVEDNQGVGQTARIDQREEFRDKGDWIGHFFPRDLDAVKRQMLGQHNSGQFNIQQMGVVAAGIGANLAMDWLDDSEYRSGGRVGWNQTGADVAAVVLISPYWNYEGWNITTNLPQAAETLPILMITGADRVSEKDADRIAKKLRLPDLADERAASRGNVRPESGWTRLPNTQERGVKLFNPKPVADIDRTVIGFLQNRLEKGVPASRRWQERRLDLNGGSGFGAGRAK